MIARIDDITGEQAAWAIERFAGWVADTEGVWAVTVAEARYGEVEMNLHLIVHAVLPPEKASEEKIA